MLKAIFNFNGIESTILCNYKDKINKIFMQYVVKEDININIITFKYNNNK